MHKCTAIQRLKSASPLALCCQIAQIRKSSLFIKVVSSDSDAVCPAEEGAAEELSGHGAPASARAAPGEVPHRQRWRQPDWGSRRSNATALDARVCPFYGRTQAASLCHLLDRFEDHRCVSAADCGTDAGGPPLCRLQPNGGQNPRLGGTIL